MTDEQLQRIHDIEYSCDSRAELAERIVALEDKLAMYENAKLVDVLHEVEEESVLAYHGLQSDIELLIKSETESFEKWWRSECRNDNKLKRIEVLDAENAKLRELLRDDLRPKYDHTLRMTPVEWREYDDDILRRACELGIEVQR